MRAACPLAAALASLLALSVGRGASAEELALRHRYRRGESYPLLVRVSTVTDASSQGALGESVGEDVQLEYRAFVVVLEVDREGRPTRERHDGVRLTFQRPGESGSLFKEGSSYEVQRKDELRVLVGGERAEPRVEKVVAEILERQFAFTLEPAFLDPGRPVGVGESWELDASLARRFLLSRGLRNAELDGKPMATLRQRPGEDGLAELVIDYRIPISRLELERMPPRAQTSKAEGLLEGTIRLDRGSRPSLCTSSLSLSLNGVVSAPQGTESVPWSLRRTVLVEQTALNEHGAPGAAR